MNSDQKRNLGHMIEQPERDRQKLIVDMRQAAVEELGNVSRYSLDRIADRLWRKGWRPPHRDDLPTQGSIPRRKGLKVTDNADKYFDRAKEEAHEIVDDEASRQKK